MSDRYARLFAGLAARGEGAFVPFLVLGDPEPGLSLELLRTLAGSGADALELGIPFSDPVADGPVIQAAGQRALAAGTTAADAWRLLTTIRGEFPDLPIGLLVYANLVMHHEPTGFYRQARLAGVDSVLVADAPLEEATRLAALASAEGVAPVLIAAPNAGPDRLAAIAAASLGYVYVTSRPGVTGADQALQIDSGRVVNALRQAGAPPLLLGFGIATPDHVRQALELGVAGAISGSAVVREVERHLGRPAEMLAAVSQVTRSLKAATIRP